MKPVSATVMKSRLKEISVVPFNHPLVYGVAPHHASTEQVKLWLQWVIASALGGIGGEVLALSLGAEAGLSTFAIVSATAAAGQWLLLKRYLPRVRWWVTLSAIGGGVGAVMIVITSLAMGLALGVFVASTPVFDHLGGTRTLGGIGMIAALIVGGLGQGAVVGLFQWLVLRGKIRRAELWIAASAVGALVAGVVTFITPALIHLDLYSASVLNTGISQGIAAAVTGIALVRLLTPRISAA